MFRFAARREVFWPVHVRVPCDYGKPREEQFTARFRLLTEPERELLQQALREGSWNGARGIVEEHVVGWEEIVDEATGEPLPFTPEILHAVLDQPYVLAAALDALGECSRGAAAKNSDAGSAG